MMLFIGQERSYIKQKLQGQALDYVEFYRWLYIPKQQILLSFQGQLCLHAKSLENLPKAAAKML